MQGSSSYKLTNQKLLQKMDILNRDINFLQTKALGKPCIVIKEFNKLQLCKTIKHSTVESSSHMEIIHKLFNLLNLPTFWIHSISNEICKPNCLPTTMNIYLITDNIKRFVYNAIVQYLKQTDQKLISVKLMNQ